jgi:hypothetical protein
MVSARTRGGSHKSFVSQCTQKYHLSEASQRKTRHHSAKASHDRKPHQMEKASQIKKENINIYKRAKNLKTSGCISEPPSEKNHDTKASQRAKKYQIVEASQREIKHHFDKASQ